MSELVINGVRYESRPEPAISEDQKFCDGCAFQYDISCGEAGVTCLQEKIIWVKAPEVPTGYVPRVAAQEPFNVFEAMSDPKMNTAPALLDKAALHMRNRAATYDKPEGERSMGKTVEAFNAITGRDLRESEGWLLLALLKMVRSEQRDAPHRDSVEDLIAYSALFGEARMGNK